MNGGIALKQLTILILGFVLVFNAVSAQTIDLRGRWKFHLGDDASWTSRTLNDAGWESVRVPAAWEDEDFHGYDGFAWYRVKFDGRKLDREGIYYLNLGFIDDADEAFLNEKMIGFSGQCPPKFKTAYNNERKYILPSQWINFDGDNVVAVRVFDVGDRGGIVDGDVGVYSMGEGARLLINLQGIWQFAIDRRRDDEVPQWEKIMVPGAWEFQGFKYDGFARYKRTFNIPANFTKEPVVVILGKIDDFDKTYFNGTVIGTTNDGRRYGLSSSYDKTRVYEIPQELIKRGANNTIEIVVEDIGNVGGIYHGGIIGITTKSNYERYFDQD